MKTHSGRHIRPVVVVALALVGLVAVSCGADDESGVAPFSDIAVSGPDIEVDPSGTAAVLAVETSIDAICAVSYGIGEPSGAIATDREMEAGGHENHRVVLSGLEPDTEYSYRLQGVAADGLLYRSDVFTFRTPQPADSSLGPNLALDATVVDVSSVFSDGFAAEMAIDGDRGTEWSSRGDGDEAFLTIDLGQSTDVRSVAFVTREMGDGSAITETFTVTVDGDVVHGPYPAGSLPTAVEFRGTVLRFDVEASSGGNTGAVEVEVYGDPPD